MFHHPSCVAIEYENCHGKGTVHVTRTRWVGGSTDGYQRTWEGDVRCEGCYGTGETFISTYRAAEMRAEPAVDRALERPHREGLTIVATTIPGVFMVSSGISRNMYYKTTLLTCYAPWDDPEIAVAVVIEAGGEGSTVAVPVADETLRAYFELTGRRERGVALSREKMAV